MLLFIIEAQNSTFSRVPLSHFRTPRVLPVALSSKMVLQNSSQIKFFSNGIKYDHFSSRTAMYKRKRRTSCIFSDSICQPIFLNEHRDK